MAALKVGDKVRIKSKEALVAMGFTPGEMFEIDRFGIVGEMWDCVGQECTIQSISEDRYIDVAENLWTWVPELLELDGVSDTVSNPSEERNVTTKPAQKPPVGLANAATIAKYVEDTIKATIYECRREAEKHGYCLDVSKFGLHVYVRPDSKEFSICVR